MIIVPIYGEPNRVTCLPCYERLVVATVVNTATPVVVIFNGVTYTSGSNLTLTARGTVCWTGVINLSAVGLVVGTRYSWTVTQGSYSDSGSYLHTPAAGTDFTLIGAGCDNNTTLNNLNTTFPEMVPGFWQYYKILFDSGEKIAGMLYPDDLGYVGLMEIYDGPISTYGNNTGLDVTIRPGATTGTQADFYIAWCAWLGMLGPTGTYTYGVEIPSTSQRWTDEWWLMLIWGRETNRAFCRKNINLFAQWGDHEFNDDMGFDYSPSLDPDGIFLRGKTAWNAFIGLGQPPNDLITPTDVTAKHWAKPVGDILMVAPDAITNATRASWITGRELATPSGINTTTTPTAFTAMLGANQIADIKAAVTAAKKPFCIFLMGNGGRYVTTRTATGGLYSTITGAVSEYNNSGTQHPIFDHCLTEWQSLVTNDSTGLMANQYTNGTLGSMAWFHSDWHHAAVYTMVHPAYTGHLAENFPSLYHGSTSGGATFTKSTYGNTGDTVGSSVRIDYVAADVAGGHQFGGLIIRVKGSTYPKTIEYDLRDINNNRVFHKKQVHQIGLNNMYDVSNDITNKGATVALESIKIISL